MAVSVAGSWFDRESVLVLMMRVAVVQVFMHMLERLVHVLMVMPLA